MFILELIIELAIDVYTSLGFGAKENRIEGRSRGLAESIQK